jgi:hypothetical protein
VYNCTRIRPRGARGKVASEGVRGTGVGSVANFCIWAQL